MVAANSINESTTGITGFTGTAFTGSAATQYCVQVGSTTTSTLASITNGTTGQVLTATTGANPSWTTIGTGITWTEETASPVAGVVNHGYILNLGSLLTLNLPSVFAIGDIINVVGKGAGLWTIVANGGDTIHFGTQDSSSGGSVTATNRYDAIQIVGTVANAEWTCTGVSQGNLTVA
jgi:hypothetical protein